MASKHLAKQNPVTISTESQAARIAELEREIRELKQANEIIARQPLFSPGGARPPTQVMVKFIDDEKEKYEVEPICRILPIAPSTYYRIKDEQDNPEKQCRRKQSDKHLMAQIKQIWQASGCRYGIRKVWHKQSKMACQSLVMLPLNADETAWHTRRMARQRQNYHQTATRTTKSR